MQNSVHWESAGVDVGLALADGASIVFGEQNSAAIWVQLMLNDLSIVCVAFVEARGVSPYERQIVKLGHRLVLGDRRIRLREQVLN